jgi:hypothetical protein
MQINSPITITPPPIGQKTFPSVTLEELTITLIDEPHNRIVRASIRPCSRPLVLWQGEDYTAAGDWTQAEAEARILELLGNNPAAVLEGLFQRPA